MAESKIEIELTWENRVGFGMLAKVKDSDPISIINIHENTDMASVWSYAADLCISYIRSRLDDIGTEMMAE